MSDAPALDLRSHFTELLRSALVEIAPDAANLPVILERPKLKDFRTPIREKLAQTLCLALDQVSVKFKTAEKVGPVGEGKSGEAQAIVSLKLG